ncbi:Glu/Leu/Phe/Val dehydrogenase dimerization domain-containing protein [Sediminitomix flava]|uniref:Leucine dehydrogenase n=1 Tax=Sediminitomix flava TaxID=379075 RepID=A0A315ZGY5_SEDFL|nr:Glu/Leu/Phe/Val dehydrogenase dimerization domain-containing protein [Sediminitomix flava]PWJ44771.1 leucine dehydrogenase [Sediminitomix flava]
MESVFDKVSAMGHEQVVYCHDKETGLKAIIGIHNTVLGPSLGGTRMWMYENEQQALNDALRLSRGMTFKNSIAGLNLGGGKAVIIGDAKKHKTEALMRAFGRFVKNLNGKYITAEDVGMTSSDMEHIFAETKHVSGLPEARGGLGDPSPFTAYTTYMGMKAAAKKAYGSDSLEGKAVSVQGAGNVGKYLIEFLEKEGCKIYVTDYYEDRLKQIANDYKVEAVGLDEIYDLNVDIYSPCALGATVNNDTLKRLNCDIIAGCSNNQLADEKVHGDLCLEKGILYAPDFLINCGGVINVYAEVIGTTKDWSQYKCEKVYDQTLKVFEASAAENKNTQEVAIEIAMKRIEDIAKVKVTY